MGKDRTLEIIKNEIERRIKIQDDWAERKVLPGRDLAFAVKEELKQLLSFLSTTENKSARQRLAEWSKTPEGRESYEKVAEEMRREISEKPMNLGERIGSYDIVPYIDDKIAKLQDMWREEKVSFDWDDLKDLIEDVARHFYDLGCRRTAEKYDEIEYNRQRAEEQGSEELSDEISHISERYPEVSFAKLSRIAVHFAKWKEAQVQETIELAEEHAYLAGSVNEREKMMKEAVEGEVKDFCFVREVNYSSAKIEFSTIPELKVGDKVRIIIVKED